MAAVDTISPGLERITLTPKQSNIFVYGFQEEARFRVAVCGRRFGKALALDTKLPTPSGWTTMGEVREGDILFDENGKPCRVVQATDVMHDRECFNVAFSDGTSIVADREHLWLTWDRCARKNAARNDRKVRVRLGGYEPTNDKPKVRTTGEISGSVVSGCRGDTNHSIQACFPIECPEASLPVPPYVLGAWLGDGVGVHAILTSNDQQIVDEIRAEGQAMTKMPADLMWRMSDCDRSQAARQNSLQSTLRAMGVLGNKHVPDAYLRASVSQRMSLLQGFMDTDGTVSVGGHCDFTNTNKLLCDAVLELTRSLGIRAVMGEGRAKLNGVDCGPKWRVTFTTSLPVFRLQRKLDRLNARKSDRNIEHRFIVSVTKVDSVPVRCVMVDSPNRLYLAGESFIVTHNSFLAAREMKRAAQLAAKRNISPDEEIWYGAPTFRQAKRVFWPRLKRAIPRHWVTARREDECSITMVTGHKIRVVGLDNYDDLRGSGLYFFVGDEWADAQPECWTEVIQPMLATSHGHALFIGTPKGHDHLYEAWQRGQPGGDPDYMSWHYTTLQGGQVPPSEVDRARRDMDARTFEQEYEAGFVNFSGRVVFAFDRNKHVKLCPFDPMRQIHIGMDFNINPMSATIWQEHGNTAKPDKTQSHQIDEIMLETANTDQMADEIVKRYARKNPATGQPALDHITIYPDPAGIARRTSAGGRTDIGILRERGFKVLAMSSHPLVRDRLNITNARFENAAGEIRSFVDPKCKKSIQAYERLTYKEGSSDPDKNSGFDHPVDASGYYFYTRFGVGASRVKVTGF